MEWEEVSFTGSIPKEGGETGNGSSGSCCRLIHEAGAVPTSSLWEKLRSGEAGNARALLLGRLEEDSASVYENLNIQSPKVPGTSSSGR